MRTHTLLPVAALVLFSVPAVAQPATALPSPLARGDASGSVGWFHTSTRNPDSNPYGDRFGQSVSGALTGGWYWTDHLKTALDISRTSTAQIHRHETRFIDGLPANSSVRYSVATHTLGVTQLYQAFRNQWVHPYMGAGVQVTWERVTEHHTPAFVYDPGRGSARLVLPERTVGPYTKAVVRPVAVLGLKAYVTPRAFVRGDLRIAFRGGVEEVLVQTGVGVDF